MSMNSFKDFSEYIYNFNRLDSKITDQCSPDKYYQRWMKKYSKVFVNDISTCCLLEWDLRCKRALREMFSSATFFVEAQKDLEMGCYASYYFCLYYSLFHALESVILMDTDSKISSAYSITHKKLINIFISRFANSSKDLLDGGGLRNQFYDLQYKREYYSYALPINNLFNYEEDLYLLKETAQDCFQLAAFHSLMVEKSYYKNVNKIKKIVTSDDAKAFNEMFDSAFVKRARKGFKTRIDPAVENYKYEILKYGTRPEYIALGLDHQYDELHTYDGSRTEDNKSKEAVRVDDVYSFVYQAINT